MYQYTSNSGNMVEFEGQKSFASRAMELVEKTGVPETHDLPTDAPVELSKKVSSEVNEVYSKLIYISRFDGEQAALDLSDRQAVEERYDALYEKNGDVIESETE